VEVGVTFSEWTDDAPRIRRLQAIGPRAVPAVLAHVRRHGTYSKSSRWLSWALREIGPSAHSQLLRAVDDAPEGWERLRLNVELFYVFDDVSRADVFYRDAIRLPNSSTGRMLMDLLDAVDPTWGAGYGEARSGGVHSHAFVVWYARHTRPKGPLPPLPRNGQRRGATR
jgi:hypothetical protein